MTGPGSTLEQLLSDVAAETGAIRSSSGPTVEFSRGTVMFAAATANVAELRLDPEIAEAALRTPATAPSSRGTDWVRLAPAEPTDMDLDRARAWFLSAWRAADR